jgi:MOSC domain-containing protein YiiM
MGDGGGWRRSGERGTVEDSRAERGLDSSRTGRILAVSISAGGVPKRRVSVAQVLRSGLVGDAQNDTKHHGGPDRAVCVYAVEVIRRLQQEGHPIDIGTAGENITVEGIDWEAVSPGLRLQLGEAVVLEVASYTNPCKTIKDSFIDGEFIRIAQKFHPGWSRVYTRVISEGEVRPGDPVRLLSVPE